MTTDKSHHDALQAYLNVIEKNVSKRADASLMEHFAHMLLSKLPDKPLSPDSYRAAVDSLLESLPPEYKRDVVIVARELFPFLISDIKSVAAMMKAGGYSGFTRKDAAIDDGAIKSMSDLIAVAEGHKFTNRESALHGKYMTCLGSLGLEESVIAMRGRISKALLYLVRNNEVTPVHYRKAINSVMPILSSEETRLYFVLVAREFYYFLTGDPKAPEMIKANEANR
jgi:hypothetical protein